MIYFLVHARWQLGREEYQIIEARHMLDALKQTPELYERVVFPHHVEVIGPLELDHLRRT